MKLRFTRRTLNAFIPSLSCAHTFELERREWAGNLWFMGCASLWCLLQVPYGSRRCSPFNSVRERPRWPRTSRLPGSFNWKHWKLVCRQVNNGQFLEGVVAVLLTLLTIFKAIQFDLPNPPDGKTGLDGRWTPLNQQFINQSLQQSGKMARLTKALQQQHHQSTV